MKRFTYVTGFVLVLAPLVAMLPLGRIAADWMSLARVLQDAPVETAPRGFDWVVWDDEDGVIRADYVFPKGPGYEAGIREGHVFYTLANQQYFNAEDLMGVVEGITPGSRHTYQLFQRDELQEVAVTFLRYPTFMYPLSSSLWLYSLWGFAFVAFLHVLALVIAAPVAARSKVARFSLLLIAFSSLWIFANTIRLLSIHFLGPPLSGSTYSTVFRALTAVGLLGWIWFPALLLRKVLRETRMLEARLARHIHYIIYLPALVLTIVSLLAFGTVPIGPFTLDNLIAPLLFYLSCYITVAAALVLGFYLTDVEEAQHSLSGWTRTGSLLMLVIAAGYALSVLGVAPLFGSLTGTTAGWLIVTGQLLTVAPVALVSFTSLKRGKLSLVMSRALAYLAVLGLIFFTYVAALALLEPVLAQTDTSRVLAGGVLVVLLVLIFERVGRHMQRFLAQFLATDATRKRRALHSLQEKMHDILDLQALTHESVQAAGDAFDTRSAVLYLRLPQQQGSWASSAYHPEPPYMTERLLERIWPHVQTQRRIWASNSELNESSLPEELDELLRNSNAVLAVPVVSEKRAIGLLILGSKRKRRDVYNLEDLDLLRSVSSQLALAAERLYLVESEKALVRATAEAQLTALRAQINPHFLFNALNTITALIEERPDEAEVTVERLAGIYRHILQIGHRPFVELEEELALVDRYLQIEQTRFGARLKIEWHVDPSLRSRNIPAFALQTLVENAVKHGLEPQRRGGVLRIEAQPATGQTASGQTVEDESAAERCGIIIDVSDTGVGIPSLFGRAADEAPDYDFFGIGLENVSARLAQLYGRNDLLQMQSSPEGTRVRMHVPLSRSAAFRTGEQQPRQERYNTESDTVTP